MKVLFRDTLSGEEIEQANAIYRQMEDPSIAQLVSYPYILSPNSQLKYALLINEFDHLQGYCVIIQSQSARLSFLKTAQVRFGPACLSIDDEPFLLSEIRRHYFDSGFALLQVQLRHFAGQASDQIIAVLGEKFSKKDETQTKCTIRIDLNQSIEQIQAGFATVLSKNIRSAINKNVKVKPVNSPGDIRLFADLYLKMGNKRGTVHYTREYIEQLCRFLITTGNGFLLCSFVENNMIGGGLFINEGDVSMYQIGASDPDFKKIPSSHLVLFEAIKHARDTGKKIFDMGGIAYYAKPGEQLHNINQFKENFSKNYVFYAPILFATLNPLKKRMLDLLVWLNELRSKK